MVVKFLSSVLFPLTVIGSEDLIFFSSSANDAEAKGAIPKSASERKIITKINT